MAPIIAAAIPSLIKLLPEVAGWFGGDKAESMASEVLDIASGVTGISDKSEALSVINSNPETALKFQQAVMNDKYRLDEMFLSDKKDARDMQKSALSQDDLFSKRFIYFFAGAWSLFAMIYIACISFINVPADSVRFIDTILGFLLGTVISAVIQFFFGSSKGSKDKNELTSELLKRLNKYDNK